MKWRKIQHIHFMRATRGWVCELSFYVRTKRQFTSEWHEIRGGSRFIWLALARAVFAMRRERQLLQEMEGGFTLE